jgi:chorismate mutase
MHNKNTKRLSEENMTVRGVRGATTVLEDSSEAILEATRALLLAICEANIEMRPSDIASIFFTVTADLRAAYPALAARELGWGEVPLMCAQEIPVPGSLPRTIRVLIHWNTALMQKDIHHVYLREAVLLRPDLLRAGEH